MSSIGCWVDGKIPRLLGVVGIVIGVVGGGGIYISVYFIAIPREGIFKRSDLTAGSKNCRTHG